MRKNPSSCDCTEIRTHVPTSEGFEVSSLVINTHTHFPCSADHEQDWQPYPVDPYSDESTDNTYINVDTFTSTYFSTLP